MAISWSVQIYLITIRLVLCPAPAAFRIQLEVEEMTSDKDRIRFLALREAEWENVRKLTHG